MQMRGRQAPAATRANVLYFPAISPYMFPLQFHSQRRRTYHCNRSTVAHAGSRTQVTSMGGLYDAATLRALLDNKSIGRVFWKVQHSFICVSCHHTIVAKTYHNAMINDWLRITNCPPRADSINHELLTGYQSAIRKTKPYLTNSYSYQHWYEFVKVARFWHGRRLGMHFPCRPRHRP